jgi:predicted nucleic acid-binding protein
VAAYVLDTNVYIDANHDPGAAEKLQQFMGVLGASVYLSAIVAQELLAGTLDAKAARGLDTDVLQPYERWGRVLTPSYGTFKRAGETLASLVRAGLTLSTLERGFVNDVLLAASCLDAGATLVTRNTGDFVRIAKHLKGFRFSPPYPIPRTH